MRANDGLGTVAIVMVSAKEDKGVKNRVDRICRAVDVFSIWANRDGEIGRRTDRSGDSSE